MEEIVFRILALCALAAFYGCYFIKMILQKKKGIATNRLGKGKKGFVKGVEIALKIATYLVPLSELASIVLGASMLPFAARVAGAAVAFAGVAVFIVSVVTMRDSWRAGISPEEKTPLVTDGIYRLSRNPAFLGFDLVYVGILLMFFNVPLLAVSLIAGILIHLQIVNVEEPFLREAFGEEYAAYQKRTRRYL